MNKKLLATIGIIGILAATMFAGCTPQAEKGLQGERGKQGEQGIQGTQGGQGIMGIQGIQGEHGLRGYDGKDGRDGKDGSDGDDGWDGTRGYTGTTGATGAPGEQGIPGADGVDGINGTDCEFQAFLLLAEKENFDDTPCSNCWNIVEGGAFGYLLYNPVGDEFEYKFEAWGLANGNYSLIYYADGWPGTGGCLIASGTSGDDYIKLEGSEELSMSLPCEGDENIDNDSYYDGSPDWYAHTHGAKIWLVLSTDYDDEAGEMTDWNPKSYLFETDLITYIDTDCGFHSDGS